MRSHKLWRLKYSFVKNTFIIKSNSELGLPSWSVKEIRWFPRTKWHCYVLAINTGVDTIRLPFQKVSMSVVYRADTLLLTNFLVYYFPYPYTSEISLYFLCTYPSEIPDPLATMLPWSPVGTVCPVHQHRNLSHQPLSDHWPSRWSNLYHLHGFDLILLALDSF